MCHVLVVDDEPAIRSTIKRMLEHAQYTVQEVGDGAEALKYIEAHHPDIVITDLYMPEFDGLALARTLRRAEHPPAIVVISGSGPGPEMEMAAALGAVATLGKPFERLELLAAVQTAERARKTA